ncbi:MULTISPECIES: tyrosine-type recombinase/integrase [unclassified Sphingopyxis]|uniref:tyrosine-type recombinase/integrase n=1 Tax=unclassified Sphingopyxis TaxID=2614943 RepID=UPI0009EC4362|nr:MULTISPECIES: site-specific integrase [unclassified Sphingopyxis]
MGEAINLSDAKLAGLKSPSSGQIEIIDSKVPGLRVRVGKSGIKSFIVRKRVGGKIKVVTLGHYGPRLGLAEARKRARSILNDIDAGISVKPIHRGGLTIAKLWPRYEKTKSSHRSLPEIRRIFHRYILPELGERFADTVTRGEVTRFIDRISAPVMARAVHAQLSSFYTWALARLDKLPSNPCAGAGRPSKPKARERVLTDRELAALWRAAEAEAEPWRSALKLLILTGQRRSKVFGAKHAEFNLHTRTWTIPAERAKNGVQHLVPISDNVAAIVAEISEVPGSPWLFPAEGNATNSVSGISKVVNRLRAAVSRDLADDVPLWSLHDIRRTVATGLQRLGVRFEVTEAVLNHVSGSRAGIAGVYQRHDWASEKRDALDAWAEFVEQCVHKGLCDVRRMPHPTAS